MNILKRKILVLLVVLFPIWLSGQTGDLEKNFRNPPSEYSLLPFWSWNGTLKAEKLTWQIDQMLGKGIYGAFLHARAGLDESETPYFSDGFWNAVDTTIKYSAAKGFQTYLYDEDKWPSGSAGGRTVAANPEEFIKKALIYSKMEVVGPQTITLNLQKSPMGVFAGRISDKGVYDFSTQLNLTEKANTLWNVPNGRWAIISLEMVKDPHEQIDYLDSAAVAKFIEITHEEYFKRFGNYFGNTIPGIFFDEIYANLSKLDDNIFWTDDFLLKFRKIKGYDLTDKLPLIFQDDPVHSAKARYDYFDVVKELYVKAWFKQYADWCEAHNIWATGHTTEKVTHYRRQSDYFSTMGQLQVPGADNEEYRYGYPRMIDWYNTKQISSIANLYNRKRVMVEAMGGGGYTIPLEEYRYGFAMLGAYGINMFVPHLFHYAMDAPQSQADWPPSWFFRNPYWKYFKPLADFGSRISYMISQGNEVCEVALLYPLTDAWRGGYPDKMDDTFYKDVQQELLNNHINYNIIDPESLVRAKIEKKQIVAGKGKYRVLILPEIRNIRTDVMAQIDSFVKNGGIVIALKDLPALSETGPAGDELVTAKVKELFGFNSSALRQDEYYQWNTEKIEHFTTKTNQAEGAAYFTRFLDQLPGIINSRINPDFVVKSVNVSYLKFNHRNLDGKEFYLLVNDRNSTEKYHISLRNIGKPSIWNPETGEVQPFENYRVNNGRMELILDFKPCESYFVILDPKEPQASDNLIESTDLTGYKIIRSENSLQVEGWGKSDQIHSVTLNCNDQFISRSWKGSQTLPEIKLTGDWQFQLASHALDYIWSSSLEADTLALPVMKFHADRMTNDGSKKRWSAKDFDDSSWNTVKITDEFNKKPGIQRYLSGWNASWISYYDYSRHLPEIEGGDRTFKKEILLDAAVEVAKLAITADQSYELLINGKVVGSDKDWKSAEVYEISGFLIQGKNTIEVVTTNTRGLLLQGSVRLKNGKSVELRSDESWMVSPGQTEWQPAFRFAAPPLGSWGNIANPLQKLEFPITVWYRQPLPPGVTAIKKPMIKGKYSLYVNGIPVKNDQTEKIIDITRLLKKDGNTIALSVIATDETCGLIHPLEVVCGKVNTPLVSWKEMGLDWYSGRAVYTKKIEIPVNYFQDKTRLMLDLGQVDYFAEIWVNGQLVTFCPWAPFEANITNFLKAGDNLISIVVANLMVNQASWNILDDNIPVKEARWWHNGSIMREKDKLHSGLLGPVRIIPFSKESVEFKIK